MTRTLDAMLDVLRCPRSGTRLHSDGRRLVSERGDHYPIVDGKPVLVRQITEAHGGSVAASNLEGGGACFTLRIPLGSMDNPRVA